MDMRRRTPDGKTVCPQCGKAYLPVLGERKNPNMNIQDEFPNSTAIEREQLPTGICSDECWRDYLGIIEDEDEGDWEDDCWEDDCWEDDCWEDDCWEDDCWEDY